MIFLGNNEFSLIKSNDKNNLSTTTILLNELCINFVMVHRKYHNLHVNFSKGFLLFFSVIILIGFVSATTLNVVPSELSEKNNAVADLSGQVAHLKTTGTVGDGDEARIV
ncbi:MAG TPA: hypothetical protein ENI22_01030, partial [Candidatus Pacearchaeota archaeon]|nr:hypothetical protein [Candidatus Pacearchaeota archaeon]